ncbi:hypothetical protein SAMN05216289_10293 [Dokdonella immobilis]|uniref:Uncharacterized protein n=1 Tax=Dokdonella immobilis TaxID=578942 RepID=A0A1I4VHL8_9GAMM|nr:hypothetical protein SAMN05216289_10293 [Dokdonella immobilis]
MTDSTRTCSRSFDPEGPARSYAGIGAGSRQAPVVTGLFFTMSTLTHLARFERGRSTILRLVHGAWPCLRLAARPNSLYERPSACCVYPGAARDPKKTRAAQRTWRAILPSIAWLPPPAKAHPAARSGDKSDPAIGALPSRLRWRSPLAFPGPGSGHPTGGDNGFSRARYPMTRDQAGPWRKSGRRWTRRPCIIAMQLPTRQLPVSWK